MANTFQQMDMQTMNNMFNVWDKNCGKALTRCFSFQNKHQRSELSYLVDRPRRVNRWVYQGYRLCTREYPVYYIQAGADLVQIKGWQKKSLDEAAFKNICIYTVMTKNAAVLMTGTVALWVYRLFSYRAMFGVLLKWQYGCEDSESCWALIWTIQCIWCRYLSVP